MLRQNNMPVLYNIINPYSELLITLASLYRFIVGADQQKQATLKWELSVNIQETEQSFQDRNKCQWTLYGVPEY